MWTLRILFLLVLVFAATPGTTAQPPFRVNTGFTPPVSTIFEQILQEVFSRLGRQLDFQELSAERSLILVNEGVDDAECCRIPDVVQREYPDLVAVPESVFEARFSAFVSNSSIQVGKWDDLKPHAVGTVTGWKILVKNIDRIQPRESYVLEDAEAMFKMLDMGRLDVATLGYLSGLKVLNELRLKDVVYALEPPLATRKLYLMVNKRHAALVPRLKEIIAALKADGTVDRIVRRVSTAP